MANRVTTQAKSCNLSLMLEHWALIQSHLANGHVSASLLCFGHPVQVKVWQMDDPLHKTPHRLSINKLQKSGQRQTLGRNAL